MAETSPAPGKFISIRGAREHNLKNVDLDLPRDRLVVLTGLSGSGKSSLAFDTIYAEGQRRYVESLSAYARQFLEMMQKPDVDQIDGLSPAISIEQKTTSRNPRSTVGTVTEIYDYMRLLFARVGVPYSPATGLPIESQTVSQMVDRVLALPEGTRLYLLAPIVRGRKGEYRKELAELMKRGFQRVKIDGQFYEIAESPALDKKLKHDIEVVVDRIVVGEGIATRLADSFQTALELAEGLAIAEFADKPGGTSEGKEHPSEARQGQAAAGRSGRPRGGRARSAPAVSGKDSSANRIIFSEKFACPVSGFTIPEIEPRLFSFNNPYGACPTCDGLGTERVVDPALVVPDDSLSLRAGAIAPWSKSSSPYYMQTLEALARAYKFSTDTPWMKLAQKARDVILFGTGEETVTFNYNDGLRAYRTTKTFEGVIPNLERRYRETDSQWVREEIERYHSAKPCETCGGKRLKPEALAVKLDSHDISQVTDFSIRRAMEWFAHLPDTLTKQQNEIAVRILKEIRERLNFLVDVGLDYLTLARASGTLSGGESQRIRLASPDRLRPHRRALRARRALDRPPPARQRAPARHAQAPARHRQHRHRRRARRGRHPPGRLRRRYRPRRRHPRRPCHRQGHAAQRSWPIRPRSPASSCRAPASSTCPPTRRQPKKGKRLRIVGATGNNLKDLTAEIPIGLFTCVTGVSGSGKSTLTIDTLYRAVARRLNGARDVPAEHGRIEGLEYLDKVIDIDQSPIGRTPRSNPATYTGAFTPIREWFAGLPEAKARGYGPGRFSFNVKGGRCEKCQGDGVIKIEMHFLPDVYVTCDVCGGHRYNRETLEVRFKNKSIADVLDMTVEEARDFFAAVPSIRDKMETLDRVGLSYIHVGQQATTLSGGEAQRVKLSKELSRRSTGRTLYILDEPTTGLHFADVEKLLDVLHELVDQGNTVVVIEHNLEVIKTADWIIDLGPEGGDGGGEIVAAGTPEQIARDKRCYTGAFLKPVLARARASRAAPRRRGGCRGGGVRAPGDQAATRWLFRREKRGPLPRAASIARNNRQRFVLVFVAATVRGPHSTLQHRQC